MPFGFNLFRYVFRWDTEKLIISYEPEGGTESADAFTDDEVVRRFYNNLDDMPIEIRSFLPSELVDNFTLIEASYLKRNDFFKTVFSFRTDDESRLTITVNKDVDFHIQKDEDFAEEYSSDGVIIYLFRNMDYRRAVWTKGDILYNIGTDLPLDKLKEIIGFF
jgi:hypothetical protein